MKELKPCPFCEGEFEIINSNGGFMYKHESVDCAIESFCETGANWMEEQSLIDALNTRPIEDALRAENERLQAYATRLLFDDTRLWYCKKCGSEFSSILHGQPKIPNAEIQCPICEDGVAVPKAWIMQDEIERLLKALDGLLDIIEEHGTPLQKAHATKLLEAREALEVKG